MRIKHLLLIGALLTAVFCCRNTFAMNDDQETLTVAEPVAAVIPESLSGKTISRIDIDLIGLVDDREDWFDMVETLIILEMNDRFSPDHLRQSVDNLYNCGRFREVHVDISETTNMVALTFSLTVGAVIRDIRVNIRGHGGVFKKDVLSVMSLYPGKVLTDKELNRQPDIIESMLKARGFPSPSIDLEVRDNPGDHTVFLQVTIRTGPIDALEEIIISGNQSCSDFRLKNKMNTKTYSFLGFGAGRLVPTEIDEDIKRLIRFYRKKRFSEMTATYTLNRSPASKGAVLVVHIDEGPRYRLEIEGNQAFSKRALKKEMVLFSRGNRNDMGLRRSLKNIKNLYWNDGYLDIDISVEEEMVDRRGKPFKLMRLNIHEKQQTIVSSLVIQGNRQLSNEEIDRQILTRTGSLRTAGAYVPHILDDDIRAIRQLYHHNGYPDVLIDRTVTFDDHNTAADIVIEITEGPLVTTGPVTFEGLRALSPAEAAGALRLTAGMPFNRERISQDEIRLASLISEKGYPHVTVKASVIMNEKKRTAEIVYRVEEGNRVTMGNIYVSGNLRTKRHVIEKEMEMAAGDPFSLTDMIKSQQNIRSLNPFQSVTFRPIGLKEEADRVDLFVETHEKKPFFIELSGGYNSEQGGFGKAAVGDRNLLGTNKDSYISWGVSETGYRGDSGIRTQRFLNTRASSVFNIYTEKAEAFNQNFGVKTQGASFGLNKKWTGQLSTSINLNSEIRRKYPLFNDQTGDGEYESRDTIAVTPGVAFDTRNNFIMPTSGLLASFEITRSYAINSRLDDFTRYQGSLRYYLPVLERLTLATIGSAGYIQPHSASTGISEDRLFFLGGISSVRGFAENMMVFDAANNPVGGRVSLSATIEARLHLWDQLSLSLFYDAGKLTETYAPADSSTRSSIGLGLGYLTPVGPINLYYGSKLDRKETESAGRVHLSIGYTF